MAADKLKLTYPVKLADGRTVAELTLRRPKVRDLKHAARYSDKTEEQETALLAALCGLAPEDMDELDLADYRKLQDAFRGMLDSGV
jgi:hypothetical protein